MIRRDFRIFRRDILTEFSQVVQVRASPTRPERAEAPSPGRALKKSPFLRTKTENAYDL